jgi:sulfinoalanine decarboxylase/sulfinoalanine decarboxylase/aspartate 1-decarboxylase
MESLGEKTEQALQRTMEIASELVEAESREGVVPHRTPREVFADLDIELDDDGMPAEMVFDLLEEVVLATPRTGSDRFFNQLFGGRDPVASAAEMLTVMMNSSMYTYKVAGPQVLIERELTRHMARLAGYEDGEGIFTPGGSLSNFVGMMMARNEARPSVPEDGMSGPPMIAYSSQLGHYSVMKDVAMLGLGRNCVRKIETDDRGRMCPRALRRQIEKDLAAGLQPFMINATAGTTVLGAYDPLEPLGEIAGKYGLWLHVDGAFGGSALVSERHREKLCGSELSDSFTWDAHKMMGVPLSCSVILVKRRGLLEKHCSEDASYLFQSDEDQYNHGTRSIQCGRRNDTFKLWAAWKHLGHAGFADRIDHLHEMAEYAAEQVESHPDMVLTKQPESVNVCFEVIGKPSDRICEHLRQTQRALVGYGIVDGRRVIRAAFVNADLTTEAVDRLIDDIAEAAEHVPDGSNAE